MMKERIDPFFDDQPPMEFVDELKKPFYQSAPANFNTRKIREGEIAVSGIYLDAHDFSDEALLETAYSDFSRFADLYGISGKNYPVVLKKGPTPCYESYKIVFDSSCTTVYSADCEGIRRAIIYLEDELVRREGAFLPKGEILRKPSVKTRITRGFFSPTNRAPKFGDELFDDIEYYPDEYLNRLAHDGTNGIWIYTSFKALLSSEYITEYGDGGEKRIEKLKKVIENCARYGIRVYVFAIEPMHLVGDLASAHADMTGGSNDFGQHAICLETEKGRKYLLEAAEKLFKLVPNLGGYIDITAGERVTSCASFNNTFDACPRCSKKSQGALLARAANLIKEGMRRAGTDAEFISWTYGHKLWSDKNILEYVENCDTDVMLMQNFEEYSYAEQVGKMRQGKDYWLSYPGPGELFKTTAKKANELGKPLFAKMQICCSHELASVPYIPTPGLIFDKYMEAYKYGVSGVMQCWYFGNYPSVMSKAAGELSFCQDFSNKDEFLINLAATYYGEAKAKAIAKAWKLFEEGYKNYPLNIMFSYYGPMHDSVIWRLQLKPKNYYLSRSWLLSDEPNGDRIHEALWQGHSLDDALTLCELMSEKWSEGLEALPLPKSDEHYTLSAAIDLLFKSGRNILRFYKLRRELGMGIGNAKDLLCEMKKIVLEEIENSRAMIPLCQADKRLGYHSEAEGFKFFPKKLSCRIAYLEELLKTEFKEIEDRINAGLPPLEFYLGMNNGKYEEDAYFIDANASEYREFSEKRHSFKVSCGGDEMTLDIIAKSNEECKVSVEFEPLIPTPTISFDKSGNITFVSEVYTHHSMFGEKIDRELERYKLSVQEINGELHYRLSIKAPEGTNPSINPSRLRLSVGKDFVKPTGIQLRFLAKWDEYPDMYLWIIPKKHT